ncbi:Cell division protein FtsX [uncultured Roseburia sp.]|uniref:Cell division protein FtsX n=1 Tax=Brotonthovivens ammoniilytica TaxID=2981725 RepID=A0ABT2TM00_9FIRM|nr:permease-like cell division protein FtsX [Brotonthovivens ammoniilytica]MCU6763240.1 permease-like cell division protein FtsX [Brotonthovivens ammoniilytica]SCJ10461.1 Cell division protein FtsX [uncultured Roseburia sp.]
MKISTFFYTLKQGCKNIMRNKMFSIASIATMAACIFMFGVFYSVVVNFQGVVKNVESGVAVTAFLEGDLSQEQITKIGDQIENNSVSKITKCEYVSAEQAWEEAIDQYFDGDSDLASGFKDDNPLADSAHYNIYMDDVSTQSALVEYLQGVDGIREVNQSEMAANVLTDFNSLIGYVSIAIIAILVCVAVFLISNTVNTGITVRKEEIKIMKLIGATDFFVRGPFIVEGILIGLIGSVIPLIVLYGLYDKIVGYVGDKFNFLNNMLTFIPVNSVFKILLPVGLVLGVGIGFIGSRFTLHRHLNV